MCLTVYKKNCFKYAKEDIVCYKVIYQYEKSPFPDIKKVPVYVSPWQGYKIDEDIVKGEIPYKAKGRGITRIDINGIRSLYGGYIHVYSNIYSARDAVENGKCLAIYECYIPKGVRYAEGVFCSNMCYAAKQIIFKKRVK